MSRDPQAVSNDALHALPRSRQFTRRDLGIDQDCNEDLNMNYDFLDNAGPPKTLRGNNLDNFSSSSGSSQSSTVIISGPANNNGATPTTDGAGPKQLQNIPLSTLETDRHFTDKIRASLRTTRLNNNLRQGSQPDQTTRSSPATEASSATKATQPLEQPTDQQKDANESTDDDDYDFTDEILPSPPVSPPHEIDPTKLYALYDFSGPDPSHIELYKDDSVELLNDSDSYWWLVRRVDTDQVGFAPAEVLETYEERLARLNCWKNEILERGKDNYHLSREELELFEYEPQKDNTLSSVDIDVESSPTKQQQIPDLPTQLLDVPSEDEPNISMSSFSSTEGSLARKSSLKRAKSTVKKSVTFAGSLPNLPEEDATPKPQGTGTGSAEAIVPLVVPKRACRTNFLINDLDEYNEMHAEAPPSPPFTTSTASGAGSIGSYSPSSNSDDDIERETFFPEDDKVPQQQYKSFGESRSEFLKKKRADTSLPPSKSLRMLDDLIQSPEFNEEHEDLAEEAANDTIEEDDTIREDPTKDHSLVSTISSSSTMSMPQQTRTVASLPTDDSVSVLRKDRRIHSSPSPYRETTAVNLRVESESSALPAKLHPITTQIFNPLMDRFDELGKMLGELSTTE